MKYAIVILDGASGWPLEQWGDKTSLQQAHTPYLDALAARGRTGLAYTVPDGIEPSSSVACMSIVGYDPAQNRIGRGAIEGAALGVDLKPGQLAMRFNLASVSDDGTLVSYNTGGIPTEESHVLVDELKAALDDDTFHLHKGVSFRHILVVDGMEELLEATYMAPHNITDKPIAPHRPSGPGSERLLAYMDAADEILRASEVNARRKAEGKLVANTAWAFWPGTRPGSMVPFRERFQKAAVLSSGVDLLKGIALLTGIDFADIDGVTDGYDNDYAAQAEGGIALFDEYDVVVLHIEAPDSAGHDGEAELKVEAIEAIDREIVSRLVAWGETHDLRILAMPDHPTPVALKTHSEEPVPFVIAGPGIEPDGSTAFDEDQARASGYEVDPGHLVMEMLLAE